MKAKKICNWFFYILTIIIGFPAIIIAVIWQIIISRFKIANDVTRDLVNNPEDFL